MTELWSRSITLKFQEEVEKYFFETNIMAMQLLWEIEEKSSSKSQNFLKERFLPRLPFVVYQLRNCLVSVVDVVDVAADVVDDAFLFFVILSLK